ncbi:hypothetical protein VN12_16700 [Pirellula sp. SH-Sr6A]|uniref:hypothetical protein n=1 Tax=Pirellula sp. SH-Sr6A TaxID=1632865 RepID=UPI00078B195E|nr:hypothetical protein [Pirellula sp. SH-Sr6A]AMV33771.1 hypothetical protein VN12_16700 [Pirellula sp. SH-Sr6A]
MQSSRTRIKVAVEPPIPMAFAVERVSKSWLMEIGGSLGSDRWNGFQYIDFGIKETDEAFLWLRCVLSHPLEFHVLTSRKIFPMPSGLALGGRKYRTRRDVIELLKALGAKVKP